MSLTFFAVCGLIFLQVVLRFFFHTGFAWGEEISRFLFVWSVFLSVPYITKNNKHVAVSSLRDIMPDKLRKGIAILVDLGVVFFACVMLVSSVKNAQYTALYHDRATAVDISMNWLFMAPVVGYALMIIRSLQTLIWKIVRFSSSFELFLNPGGMYSESWDVAFVGEKYRKELRGASYNEKTAEEERARKNKKKGACEP